MKLKLVHLLFDDHSCGAGWTETKDYEDAHELEPLRCEAVGWIIRETKKVVVLAGMVSSNFSDVNSKMHILKSAILKRKNLRA